MAIALVKALGQTTNTTGSTAAATTTGAVAAGNHIIGIATSRLTNIVTLSSVAATGATFQVDATLGAPTGGTGGFGIFSAYLAAGLATATSITATFSASSSRHTIALFEFSGLATTSWAYGALTANAATASNPQTMVTLTGLTVGDLLIGGVQYNNNSGAQLVTAGSGWTQPTAANGGDVIAGASSWDEGALEYILSAGATSEAVAFAMAASVNWTGGGVAYHAAAAAGGPRRSGAGIILPSSVPADYAALRAML